jgi:CheY-like chemotaxis protein
MNPTTLLLCNDLIFSTKILGTAKELGLSIASAPNAAAAERLIHPELRLLLVDLASPASTTSDDLRRLRAALPADARLLAYGSHIDVDRLRLARSAGCDPVLARSEFSAKLTEILQEATSVS